jgi:hypothetical protein
LPTRNGLDSRAVLNEVVRDQACIGVHAHAPGIVTDRIPIDDAAVKVGPGESETISGALKLAPSDAEDCPVAHPNLAGHLARVNLAGIRNEKADTPGEETLGQSH